METPNRRRSDDMVGQKFLQYLIAPVFVLSVGWGAAYYYLMPRMEANSVFARQDIMTEKLQSLQVQAETRLSDTKERIMNEMAAIKQQLNLMATATDAKYITQRLERIDANLVEVRTMLLRHLSDDKPGAAE
jgi:hypothetical protein